MPVHWKGLNTTPTCSNFGNDLQSSWSSWHWQGRTNMRIYAAVMVQRALCVWCRNSQEQWMDARRPALPRKLRWDTWCLPSHFVLDVGLLSCHSALVLAGLSQYVMCISTLEWQRFAYMRCSCPHRLVTSRWSVFILHSLLRSRWIQFTYPGGLVPYPYDWYIINIGTLLVVFSVWLVALPHHW